MISRRPKVGVIDFTDDEFGEDDVRYCPHCLDYGWKEKLGPKLLMAEEQKPADFDQWLQCLECGTLYARHEVTRESEIKDVVSTTDSPFDSGVEFLGIDRRVLGKKSKRKQQQDNDYDWINDENLKQELKKGGKLLSYSESNTQ